MGVSSLHLNFLPEGNWQALGAQGFLQRTGQQFHWRNEGYRTFDDFLAALASRKRKTVRKERAEALSSGLTIKHVTGRDITEGHWDAFFAFYNDTGNRKWGQPYLNRKFFSLLGQAMADRCLLILVERGGRLIAGALNMIGGDCLYGRYWGCTDYLPNLHFECCYYQAIEFCIERNIPLFEGGAQGEHKLARGFTPVQTCSTHWLRHPAFANAVEKFLEQESEGVEHYVDELNERTPFKK